MPAVRAGRMAVVPAATSRPGALPEPKRISVLGATGSVGTSTLDLIGRNPQLFEIVALTAQSNVEALAECALRHRAALAVVADPSRYQALKERLAGSGIEVAAGCRGADRGGRAAGRLRDGRHQRRRGPRPDHGGGAAGPPRGARQQGVPGIGGRDLHGGGAPGGHRAGAGRFGALGRIPGASPAPSPPRSSASFSPPRAGRSAPGASRSWRTPPRSRRCAIPTGRWAARSPSIRRP